MFTGFDPREGFLGDAGALGELLLGQAGGFAVMGQFEYFQRGMGVPPMRTGETPVPQFKLTHHPIKGY